MRQVTGSPVTSAILWPFDTAIGMSVPGDALEDTARARRGGYSCTGCSSDRARSPARVAVGTVGIPVRLCKEAPA